MGLEHEIQIEGFIQGREYAIEGVMTAGVFHPFTIFDKPDPLDGPFFEETIYVTPSRLPDSAQAEIVREVGRAAEALRLYHGPVHAECRVGPGGVFVLEALSVMSQVTWFKYTARMKGKGQRLFLMAPLHHHFEKKGWAESKIIVRFWILGLLFSLVAFGTLKIR